MGKGYYLCKIQLNLYSFLRLFLFEKASEMKFSKMYKTSVNCFCPRNTIIKQTRHGLSNTKAQKLFWGFFHFNT